MIQVEIKKLNPMAEIPEYMTVGSAGCDIKACLQEPIQLLPGQRAAISTGLAFGIPEGFEIQVRPRSGLSLKKGLTVINAPGTIDCDYRGEVKVLLVNHSNEVVTVSHGERIAQCILNRVNQIDWKVVNDLAETTRGAGGFGSTGH